MYPFLHETARFRRWFQSNPYLIRTSKTGGNYADDMTMALLLRHKTQYRQHCTGHTLQTGIRHGSTDNNCSVWILCQMPSLLPNSLPRQKGYLVVHYLNLGTLRSWFLRPIFVYFVILHLIHAGTFASSGHPVDLGYLGNPGRLLCARCSGACTAGDNIFPEGRASPASGRGSSALWPF